MQWLAAGGQWISQRTELPSFPKPAANLPPRRNGMLSWSWGGVVRSKHLESSVRIRYVVYYRRGGECTHEQFQSQKNLLFRPFRGKEPKCPQVASKCVAKINFRDETQLHGFHLVLFLRLRKVNQQRKAPMSAKISMIEMESTLGLICPAGFVRDLLIIRRHSRNLVELSEKNPTITGLEVLCHLRQAFSR